MQNDLSRLFLSIHAQVRQGLAGPVPAQAAAFKYLFVRGFMGNHINDYLEHNIERFKDLGLDAGFVKIASEGDRPGNLAKIGAAVLASDKPVILIGHSRGGNLVHDWYRLAAPAEKAKTAKLVLLQAPLAGSPVADFVLGHWSLRSLARALGWLPHWGDVQESIRELSTAGRQQTLARMPALEPADLDKIYVIYSAFNPDLKTPWHRDMRQFCKIISQRSKRSSDGLTSVDSAQVPGAHNICLQGLDHEDTVIQDAGWLKRLMGSRPNPAYRAGDITETILRLILRNPRHENAAP
ncbi:MAG TPA: hypothetical protein DEB40_11285 [Elusimicrobia bacterium]|nr:hypothetical protein [Elusimicrobiota bacterium]HBT62315.1 hypothetical protein [Elusimicrobiota bacterium]